MNDMKTSVIVYGPTGCGKSTNAERIRAHFGLERVVDDFDPIRVGCSLAGVLYLTADSRAKETRMKSSLVKVLNYADVMAEIDAATLLLTDWIPCTTPPVRDGEYEFERVGVSYTGPLRCLYKAGRWSSTDGICELDAITKYPGEFHWRGVRRWVLTAQSLAMDGETCFMVSKSGRHPVWHYQIDAATLGFETQAEAEAFAKPMLSKSGYQITAVLA